MRRWSSSVRASEAGADRPRRGAQQYIDRTRSRGTTVDQTPHQPRGGRPHSSIARALTAAVRRRGERPVTLMGRMLPAALVVVLAGGLAVGIGAMTGALDSTAAEGRPSAGATPSPTGNAGLRSGSATVPRTAQPSSGPSEPARRPAREDGAPVPGTDPQPSSEQVTSEPTRPAASSRRVPSQTPQAGSTEAPAGTRAA